jgi:ABC-type nitrate/sulfonate/bicarbonate transport system ATPase subunit
MTARLATRAAGDAVRAEAVAVTLDDLHVLESVSFGLAPGDRLAVVGPSGCGKSTLLQTIAGLIEPTAGTLEVGGRGDAAGRLAGCALMPQDDLLLPWRSALDNAALGLQNAGVPLGDARRAAAPLFERFGLGGFELTRPAGLSGGMRQRVAFLRTLLAGKDVLLLDEPFARLDALTREELQGWLVHALDQEPRTVVLVTHDVDEALRVCGRVVVLAPRPATVLFDSPTAGLTREAVLERLRR